MLNQLTEEDVLRLKAVFYKQDVDGNGTLDFIQLREMWKEAFGVASEDELDKVCGFIMDDIDEDGDDEVSWQELSNYLQGVYEDPDEAEILTLAGLSGY
eukprot:gene15607-8964_t